MVTSPLVWTGSKRWQVPALLACYDRRRRLVEPFCGGLNVALGLYPERALLNDANPHLINFWRWVRAGYPFEVKPLRDAEDYYDRRERFNQLIQDTIGEGSLEAATLFYALNCTAFNHLCRFNAAGEFNVPLRPGALRAIPPVEVSIPQDWTLQCGDFAQIDLQPDDFVYADPPYDDGFTAYNSSGFDWDDQVRLADWLMNHDGPVVLMNKATPRILKLYALLGFKLELIDAPQRMHHSRGRGEDVLEVMATK